MSVPDDMSTEIYKMDSRPRGVCVIINNELFRRDHSDPDSVLLRPRYGTNLDRDKLEATFSGLEFDVKSEYNNLTETEMMSVIHKWAQHDHSRYCCFVCCILTHGGRDVVYGADGIPVRVRSLIKPFRPQSCPTLAGKPKLFFMQACQGSERQRGYPENVLEYDASPENDSDRAAEVLVPNEADFLLAYSTVPGFVSVRHKTEGSWYIRPLTKLLNEHAHCRDLVDILTMVNREVGKMYTADGFRQAPAMMSMLRKKVIFEEHFRLLLFGKTGAGKSSTGNTILSAKLFGCNSIFSGCTKTCELRRGNIGHHTLEVMDSPGLYDKDKENEVITTAIVQAVAGMHPGPHAILYVVQVGRYLDQEYGAYRHLKALFDEGITKYIIVLFTHGDRLQFGQTVEDALRQSPNKELSQVLDECNNRHVIFNNNANDPRPQVEKLMEMVRQLNRENKRPYKCPKYMSIGENLEKEVAVRLEKVEEEETRKLKVVQKLQTEKKAAEEGLQKAQQVMKKMQLEHERQMQEEQEKREAAKRLMEGTPAGAQLNDEAQGEEEKAPGQHLERKTEAIAKLEEEIEQEKQILEAKEKECAELEARQREEELRETERRRERYEKEVNFLKDRIAEMKEKAFIDKARSECAMITEKIAH